MSNQITQPLHKRTVNEWLVRLLVLFIGIFITHFGAAMFVISEVGAECFTLLAQGTSVFFNTTIGTAQIGILIVMSIAIFKTGYLKIGSLLCVFCGGPVVDLFVWINNGAISQNSSIAIRAFSMFLGLICIAIGVTIMIRSDAGSGPHDLLSFVIVDKLNNKINYRYIRMCVDISYVTIGTLLGGTFGIGTFVAAASLGPLIQYFMPFTQKQTDKIFSKFNT